MAARDEIIRRAKKYGLDPAAVLAVARGEGGLVNRAEDVGDLGGGGSYGPFQLYTQGALPKRFRGKPKAADAWAWSPAGIDYALRKMKEAGASGLKGQAAVNAIVRRFERPADPDTSVAKAIARLGAVDTATGPAAAPLHATGSTQGPALPPQVQVTLNSIFKKVGLPTIGDAGEFKLGKPQPIPAQIRPQQTPAQETAATAKAIKGAKLPKIQRMINLIDYAQQLGLSVRENPYVDPVQASSHVSGSHHTQTLGNYKGKKVGRAIDVSGDPARMRAFFAYAERFAGNGLNDLFYDPMGYSYDRGKRWDKTIGGHSDHVHLSV